MSLLGIHWAYYVLYLAFDFITILTLMNMLIGIHSCRQLREVCMCAVCHHLSSTAQYFQVKSALPYVKEMYMGFARFWSNLVSSRWLEVHGRYGVMCEVVSNIASESKEEVFAQELEHTLTTLALELDADGSGCLSKEELFSMIADPTYATRFHNIGVDIVGVADFARFIFDQ